MVTGIGTLTDGADELRLEPGQDLVLVDANGQEILRIDASAGIVTLRSATGRPVLRLAGRQGNLSLGGEGVDGDLLLFPRSANVEMPAQAASIRMNADAAQIAVGLASAAGSIEVRGENHRLRLDASQGRLQATGAIEIRALDGDARVRILSDARVLAGGDGHAGTLRLRNGAGDDRLVLDANLADVTVGGAGEPGLIRVRDAGGETTLLLNGDTGNLAVGGANEHGAIFVKAGTGSDADNVFVLNGERGDVTLGRDGRGSDVSIRDDDGLETLLLRGKTGNIALGRTGRPGNLFIKNDAGQNSIHLSGEHGHANVSGNVNVKGNVNVEGDVRLANADCAEAFTIDAGAQAAPGMVMVLRAGGTVAPCNAEYDRRVVGVVSGAGSLRPAIILNAGKAGDEGHAPLALSGMVYCLVDADPAPVAMGDLLTTGCRAGHARKASDTARALGAVIGKAMEPLEAGQGLIRVLACLG